MGGVIGLKCTLKTQALQSILRRLLGNHLAETRRIVWGLLSFCAFARYSRVCSVALYHVTRREPVADSSPCPCAAFRRTITLREETQASVCVLVSRQFADHFPTGNQSPSQGAVLIEESSMDVPVLTPDASVRYRLVNGGFVSRTTMEAQPGTPSS